MKNKLVLCQLATFHKHKAPGPQKATLSHRLPKQVTREKEFPRLELRPPRSGTYDQLQVWLLKPGLRRQGEGRRKMVSGPLQLTPEDGASLKFNV